MNKTELHEAIERFRTCINTNDKAMAEELIDSGR